MTLLIENPEPTKTSTLFSVYEFLNTKNGTLMEMTSLESSFFLMACFYSLLSLITLCQFVRNVKSYTPWTVQKVTHLLLFLLTTVRSLWLFLVGFGWCGVTNGTLDASCRNGQRELFYILDQFPGLLFFSIYTLLVLFWAEVYYNAADHVEVYREYVKPLSKILNMVVYTIQVIFWILLATEWSYKNHYVEKEYAIFTTCIFVLMAISFIYFGRKAYVELGFVPIELDVRNQKLMEVAVMTTVFTSCFTLRSIVLIGIAMEKNQLHSNYTWLMIFLFFGMLEIFPCLVVLYFHRKLPFTTTTTTTTIASSAATHRYARLPGKSNLERESLHKVLLSNDNPH